jgi:hypothetical protein
MPVADRYSLFPGIVNIYEGRDLQMVQSRNKSQFWNVVNEYRSAKKARGLSVERRYADEER